MSFARTITTYNNKSVQQKTKEINERRRQSEAFLRRNKDQKKLESKGAPQKQPNHVQGSFA
jgi:hypothetical protein